jgi:hypothetical protein
VNRDDWGGVVMWSMPLDPSPARLAEYRRAFEEFRAKADDGARRIAMTMNRSERNRRRVVLRRRAGWRAFWLRVARWLAR